MKRICFGGKTRRLWLMLAAAALLAVLALPSLGAQTQVSSEALDFRTKDSISDAAHGYSWDKDSLTLTLSGLTMELNTALDTAIYLPAGATVQLTQGTENKVILPQRQDVKQEFYGIRCEGNLTIAGEGSLAVSALQTCTRVYGIRANALTVKQAAVSVQVCTVQSASSSTAPRCHAVSVLSSTNTTGALLLQEGASLSAVAGGITQSQAAMVSNMDAYGVLADTVRVENSALFGGVGDSFNAGSGNLMTAGVRGRVTVVGTGMVKAQNKNPFDSQRSAALWGRVSLDGTPLELHGAAQPLHADTLCYGQSHADSPLMVGTAAVFMTPGGALDTAQSLTSPHSDYTFLGWFDEKGSPYTGDIGKTYRPRWEKNGRPVFYGTLDFTGNAPSVSDSAYGYAWDGQTKTLTLNGLCLYAPCGGIGIALPEGARVVCLEDTLSEVLCDGVFQGGINAGIYADGPVAFSGKGTLYAKGGAFARSEVTVSAGIYGAFTLDGATLHVQGSGLDFFGSVGMYLPSGACAVVSQGTLTAYGKGRAAMLVGSATLTAAQNATWKAGNESASDTVSSFSKTDTKKHLSISVPDPQTNENGGTNTKPPVFSDVFAGEGGRILLMTLYIGVAVGAVLVFDRWHKKHKSSAEKTDPSENDNADSQ